MATLNGKVVAQLRRLHIECSYSHRAAAVSRTIGFPHNRIPTLLCSGFSATRASAPSKLRKSPDPLNVSLHNASNTTNNGTISRERLGRFE